MTVNTKLESKLHISEVKLLTVNGHALTTPHR